MAAQEIPLAGIRNRLLSRNRVAESTMAFHFARPAVFTFKAGQAGDLTLLNPPKPTQKEISAPFQLPAHPSKSNSRLQRV